jgi:arylsulfatase
MRGAKGTPYQGRTSALAFFRWTGAWEPGDRDHLTAAIDIFVPILRDPKVSWRHRIVFTHVGRWPYGQAANSKYNNCSMRTARYSMVNIAAEEMAALRHQGRPRREDRY